MLKKIAVTGATSTLGVAVINECIKHEIEVIAFMNPRSQHEKRIPKSSLVKIVPCALEQQKFINVTGIKAEAFIHLAWQASNSFVRNDVMPQVENIGYALDSVLLAEKLGCSGQMTRLECRKRNIKHIWPRILSTYGPNTQDSTIINYTIRCLLKGKCPELTACEQIWDFLYVDDAARALLLLADKGRDGEVYIISSGTSQIMRKYIEIIHNKINAAAKIGYGCIPYNSNSIMHLEGDISKINKELGFRPTITFEEGIEKTIEWAKKYYR